MSAVYLRYESGTLDDAKRFRSIAAATRAFERTARELDRYGQPIAATLHVGPCLSALDEYPDYVLSLGPRGGLRRERC